MTVFKILLIILIALPLIAFIVLQYLQVLGYIRARNRSDEARERARRKAAREYYASLTDPAAADAYPADKPGGLPQGRDGLSGRGSLTESSAQDAQNADRHKKSGKSRRQKKKDRSKRR